MWTKVKIYLITNIVITHCRVVDYSQKTKLVKKLNSYFVESNLNKEM